jgi:hypothetical protein
MAGPAFLTETVSLELDAFKGCRNRGLVVALALVRSAPTTMADG